MTIPASKPAFYDAIDRGRPWASTETSFALVVISVLLFFLYFFILIVLFLIE
jgi:hypothetical protein